MDRFVHRANIILFDLNKLRREKIEGNIDLVQAKRRLCRLPARE